MSGIRLVPIQLIGHFTALTFSGRLMTDGVSCLSAEQQLQLKVATQNRFTYLFTIRS